MTQRPVNNQVWMDRIYSPANMITSWFKFWTFHCGFCGRDVQRRWGWFGKAKCPYCEKVNVPSITLSY